MTSSCTLEILISGKTGNKKGKKRDAWITRKEPNPVATSEAMPPPPKPKPRSSPESPAKKFVDSQQPEPSKTNSKVRFPLRSNTAIGYGMEPGLVEDEEQE